MAEGNVMEKIVSLCKRRGFVYPASEIYGGINGFWDYGPLGSLLKNNIRDSWWRTMVEAPPIGPDGHPIDMVGVDTAIIQHQKTWVASGHAQGFADPMVDCRETKQRYRADQLWVFAYRLNHRNPDGSEMVVQLAEVGNNLEEAKPAAEKRAAKLAKKYGGFQQEGTQIQSFMTAWQFK